MGFDTALAGTLLSWTYGYQDEGYIFLSVSALTPLKRGKIVSLG